MISLTTLKRLSLGALLEGDSVEVILVSFVEVLFVAVWFKFLFEKKFPMLLRFDESFFEEVWIGLNYKDKNELGNSWWPIASKHETVLLSIGVILRFERGTTWFLLPLSVKVRRPLKLLSNFED